MSISAYTGAMKSKKSDLQVWNNAAYDNGGESQDPAALQFRSSSFSSSCSSSSSKFKEQHQFLYNSSDSFKSDHSSKENLTPNTVTAQRSTPKPPKTVFKENVNNKIQEKLRIAERDIDSEIQDIEKEINRLSSRLEILKLEQLQRNVKAKFTEKRGRVVPAKFMDPKPSSKIQEKIEDETLKMGPNARTPRRGLSMGPSDIMKTARRGISLGPSEIYSVTKQRQGMTTPAPIPSNSQSRRKSCFWKLGEIDELRVAKERGKSLSLSPKSRKAGGTVTSKPHAATTIGSKKLSVKKEDALISAIQPKKLFNDVEKSVPKSTSKKPVKSGRVVASRYNQQGVFPVNPISGSNSAVRDLRKRSLPQNVKEEVIRGDKKRVSLTAKVNAPAQQESLAEARMKKRWEIPNQVVIYKGVKGNNSDNFPTTTVTQMLDTVPKIQNLRCTDDSPRDSGPAKRVAELVGRKSYFSVKAGDVDGGVDGPGGQGFEVEQSVCQALSFFDDEEEEEEEKNEAVDIKSGCAMIRTLHCIEESPRDSGPAKRVSELIGRKSFFAADDSDAAGGDTVGAENGYSFLQALSFAEEDDNEN